MNTKASTDIFIDVVNTVRVADLLDNPDFKDPKGLVEFLFPELVGTNMLNELLNHPEMKRIVSEKVLGIQNFMMVGIIPPIPDFDRKVGAFMGVSVNVPSPGIPVLIENEFVEPGNYGLSWNFYIDEGKEHATPLGGANEEMRSFSGNDAFVGLFLEHQGEELQKGIPLGLIPVIPLFSGRAVKSALNNNDFASKTARSLSSQFTDFDPQEQADSLMRRQGYEFLKYAEQAFDLKDERYKAIMGELHTSIMASFDKLLPFMEPSTDFFHHLHNFDRSVS